MSAWDHRLAFAFFVANFILAVVNASAGSPYMAAFNGFAAGMLFDQLIQDWLRMRRTA